MDSSAHSSDKSRTMRNVDLYSGLAFLGGGLLSLGGVINNIHNKFYHAMVLGYGEVKTVFNDIVHQYIGNYKLGENNTEGKFVALHAEMRDLEGKLATSALSTDEYRTEVKRVSKAMQTTATEFRHAIEERVERVYGIKTRHFHWWTDGAWKRYEHLGVTARREAGLGIAALGAVGLGAVLLLRSQKHSLDEIDDKLDRIQDSQAAR